MDADDLEAEHALARRRSPTKVLRDGKVQRDGQREDAEGEDVPKSLTSFMGADLSALQTLLSA